MFIHVLTQLLEKACGQQSNAPQLFPGMVLSMAFRGGGSSMAPCPIAAARIIVAAIALSTPPLCPVGWADEDACSFFAKSAETELSCVHLTEWNREKGRACKFIQKNASYS